MKRILIVSGVAVLALAAVTSAAFSTNLTVGSKGADVTALQTWLIAHNFSIAAGATGYFGSQTKAALASYQTSVGLPAFGFFGPLTQAKLNGGTVAVTPSTACPVGFTCTATPGSTPVVGTTGTISTPGAVGTLAVSLWSTPSGIVAYKGQAYDVAAYKVQASASDMAIQNLTLDFDVRLWLYASSITIKDDSGAVVGQVNNLNSSNFSELTVGSDYRVSVPVNGYVVRATQIKYLTVNVSFLPTSDRATGTVNVLSTQIRSVDGTGVTDTEINNSGVATPRAFTYQGSGAGSIIVTTDSASPATGLVQLSTSAQTQAVPLAIFDVKSQNAPSTMQSLTLIVRTAGAANVATLFSNIQIQAAGLTYSANTITANGSAAGFSSSTVVFTNLNIPLAADQYIPVKVLANVAVDTNNTLDGTISSTTLAAAGTVGGTTNNPSVVDQSYNTLAVNTANFSSNVQTFTGSSVVAAVMPVTYGNAINTTGGTTTQQFAFNFSLTAGNNPIYVSTNALTALSTTTNPAGMTITSVNFSDSDTSGDGTGYFYLAPGQTKSFVATYSGSGLTSNGGTVGVTSINYGTTTSATGASLTQSTIQNTLKAILYH